MKIEFDGFEYFCTECGETFGELDDYSCPYCGTEIEGDDEREIKNLLAFKEELKKCGHKITEVKHFPTSLL